MKALRQNHVGLAEKTLCQLRRFSLVNRVGPNCNSSEVAREVANDSLLILRENCRASSLVSMPKLNALERLTTNPG